MIHQITAVLDRAVDAYGRPVFTQTIGQAIRAFTDEVNDNKESAIHKHPGDHDLYHLGNYDDATGQFVNLEEPVQIAIGKNAMLTKRNEA